MKFSIFIFIFLFGLIDVHADEASKEKVTVKSGEVIAFMGDSITAGGRNPGGYCSLVLSVLKNEGLEVSPVFAGRSGHKSNQMLARLEKDVLSKKPDWMTLSCGVNDVWHGSRGVNLEDYKKNMTEIVEKAQAAGVKVMILTSTMIKEDQKGDLNQKLIPYNAFLRELAVEKKCLLADLNHDMQESLKAFPADAPKGKQLTTDGVHMNQKGNFMMATGVLKAFKVSDVAIDKMVEIWKNTPDGKTLRINLKMSINEYESIQKKEEIAPEKFFTLLLDKKKKEILKAIE